MNLPRFTRAHVAEKLIWLDGKPFRFTDYPFIKGIYNIEAPEIVLKTGRQVSKSCHEDTRCLLADGSTRSIRDVRVGDVLATMAPDTSHMSIGDVTWKSRRYHKPCVEITTRLGHRARVATTHPIRCWDSWIPAGRLAVGDRVATPRKAGLFHDRLVAIDDDILSFVAFMLGRGRYEIGNIFAFIHHPQHPAYKSFMDICKRHGWDIHIKDQYRSQRRAIHLPGNQAQGSPKTTMDLFEISELKTYTKRIPWIVWKLDRQKTALFINKLWSAAGYILKQTSTCHVGCPTMSLELAHGVQQLLWKFGIPSCIHTNKRNLHVVRVETREGVESFLEHIGALGKSEDFKLPKMGAPINNRDTYPKEISELILAIYESAGNSGHKGTLHSNGLRKTLKHAPTRPKLEEYVSYFKSNLAYDQSLVAQLEVHLDTHIYWDRITKIRKIGRQPCFDISVRGTENFVSDGIISHNSTTCANLMLIDSIVIPHFRTLFIAPSREQTSKFSNTRLSKIIHYSPLIRKTYVNPKLPNNVLLQILANGSEMSLSYADEDPDRVRGITADRELIDEVQDILYDEVIPVVKECMANSDYGYVIYAGTPKSMENTIEFIWKRSTQSEWIMECKGCGKWQFVDSAKSLGKTGVVCLKCDKKINVRNGQWYDFNPGAKIKGFHISQPIMPKNNENQMRWDRILEKLESYSETKLKNEVLGISDAVGFRYISQDELVALCADYFVDLPMSPRIQENIRAITGGVDWGGGGSSSEVVSRTVAWVMGLTTDFQLKTLYFKVFPEDNPSANVDEVARIFGTCGCQTIIGDAGGGAVPNSSLRDKLGSHRVFQCQYGGGTGYDKLVRWSKQAKRYLVNRTGAIDSYMLALKNKEVVFPHVRQMAVPISDVLNVYEEVTQQSGHGGGRKVWRHAPNAPDDCLHAMIYAWLAMKILQGDLEFYERRDLADAEE